MSLRTLAARSDTLRAFRRAALLLNDQFGMNLLAMSAHAWTYGREYRSYRRGERNANFELSLRHAYPCLTDNTGLTPVDPIYFYQDAWAAGKVFALKPPHHYDVGSSVKTVGILSQFTPTTMIDIRPADVALPNLSFLEGSILALPFADGSIGSLSSICVLEHIGLGRYGDPLDPWGSEKSCAELRRVLRPGGDLLISVPVDEACRVHFNAHRTFTRDYILRLFADCTLVEERYIYGRRLEERYDPAKKFGTGLFHLRKGRDAR